LEQAKPHKKQTHKGNLLHSNQAKRQRFKKAVSLGTSKPKHKANPQSKIYCTPTKQNGKGLKAVSLGTTKPPPSKGTKEIYCTCKAPSKTAKYKEAVTLFYF